MPQEYDFVEGLDPTPLGSISASELLQMIRQAIPRTTRGLIIYQESIPSVNDNIKYKGYGWIKPSENPKKIRWYNEVSQLWELQPTEQISIGTDELEDDSVTTDKIAPGPATYLIRTNLAGTAVEWYQFTLENNSIILDKISKVGATDGQLIRLSLDGSVIQWFTLNPLDYIAFDSIGLAYFEKGASRQIPRMDVAGVDLVYEDFPSLVPLINSITPAQLTPGASGQILRTKEDGINKEWRTVFFQQEDNVNLDGRIGALIEFNHGLGYTPTIVQFRLVCIANDALSGRVEFDELDVSTIQRSAGGATEDSCFQVDCNAATISCQVINVANDFQAQAKGGGGGMVKITPANYRLKGTAVCFKFI